MALYAVAVISKRLSVSVAHAQGVVVHGLTPLATVRVAVVVAVAITHAVAPPVNSVMYP